VPDRVIRFTEQFFDRLAELLPEERGADGSPSITDFLLLDLPAVRNALAADFERFTLATHDPDVRVYIGAGVLVRTMTVYASIEQHDIEAFWIELERFEE
jgi:hypothetical protein